MILVLDVSREVLQPFPELLVVVKLSSLNPFLSIQTLTLSFMSGAEREETKCLKYFEIFQR